MPNIKQQKQRVRTAALERVENLRFQSAIKTHTKRLQAAVGEGDKDVVAKEYRDLVKLIDRAVAQGSLHRNTGGRKKAQAARLVSPAA
jgi:small subunit ribosomal protein S20